MLLAQLQAADAAAVGTWIGCFFGLVIGTLTVIWVTRQLWVSFNAVAPPVPAGQDHITREEFAKEMACIREEVKGMFDAFQAMLLKQENDTVHKIEGMEKYFRETFHRMADVLNALGLKMERNSVLLELYTSGPRLNDPNRDKVRGESILKP